MKNLKKTETNLIAEALHPLKVPIDSVFPDPHNVRRHPECNKKAIKKSLQGFQQRKPIVVNKNTNIIEACNGLWEQMKAIGAKEIAVVFVDDTDEMAKAYGIMDNRSAELAEWDLPGLKDILLELDSHNLDMDLTGYDAESIEQLMAPMTDPNAEWQGMPECTPNDDAAYRRVMVHFRSEEDAQKFSDLIGQELPHHKANGGWIGIIWFPPKEK